MSGDPLAVFPLTASVTDGGHLSVGGCDVVDLARQYGTPLYLFDEATIRRQCRNYVTAFSSRWPRASVLYAGKAYLGLCLARLMRDEGLGLDVVSGGEMHVARAAGFPPGRVYLHGNNKTADELREALAWRVGRIVVDNLHELAMLAQMAQAAGRPADILLRLAPAVDPHTHRYIATGVADSKFGLPIAAGMAAEAVARASASPWLRLRGYHAHIGSQVHDLLAYRETIEVMAQFAAAMSAGCGYAPQEICAGGGWAVRYTAAESEPSPDNVADMICTILRSSWEAAGLPLPALSVEPGRALVARAGVALYTVGGVKEIAGVRRFAFVDGGMADNIRPALYQARYTALIANRASEVPGDTVTVAGRYCESGDILIRDALLAGPQPGDILAVAACGAYTLSMASNYNLVPRPPVVAVLDGRSTLWRRRETYDDLTRCDVA
jgi:diaminopimelate decarboxylase